MSAAAEDRVRIEAAFEPQQQAVVALPGCIDRFLVDQHGIDHAAHLDQLLPVAAKPHARHARLRQAKRAFLVFTPPAVCIISDAA